MRGEQGAGGHQAVWGGVSLEGPDPHREAVFLESALLPETPLSCGADAILPRPVCIPHLFLL